MEYCPACHHPIEGRSLSALGRTWHVGCFVCAECKWPLSGSFIAKDGQPYHEGCYHQRFSPRCAGCGQPLTGEYITAMNQSWHAEHFACANCQQPIAGRQFYEKDGRPFCADCYHQAYSPRCAACGQPLTGEYVTALGQTWHAAHFTCAGCGQPFHGKRFLEKEGRPYCQDCYRERFHPRCHVCQQPMPTRYLSNAWGDQYCQRHEKELPKCFSCERLVCDSLTGGGVRYADGRWMCTRCRRTAVDQERKGLALLASVQQALGGHGLDFSRASFPLRLVDQPELKRLSTRRQTAVLAGVTRTQVVTQGGQEIDRQVQEIAILHGLSAEHFAAVAAHELGHAWLFTHSFDGLPLQVEEGLCELSAYLWLQAQDTPRARLRLQAMQDNPDPTYGEGFRKALQGMQRYGLSGLLQRLRDKPRWPRL